MKRWSQNEGTRRHLWNRALILPLCACLVLAGSVTHPVWSAGASEDERLHELLRGKKVHAAFKSYGFVSGQVLDVQDKALRIDVTKSFNPSLISTGVQDIPIGRISTVRWTAGSKNRKIFFTVGFAIGILGGLWNAGSSASLDGANVFALMGTTAGGGLLGYFVGSTMDHRSIDLGTHRPPAGRAPKK